MENIFDTISVAVSLTALFIVFSVVLFNLYLIKRNGFHVNVNCWFCNKWTKVLYRDRNGFECPSCLQYNGFKEDGSYNKVIEAQYMTVPEQPITNKTETATNGLCSYCNNNQQLKIHQLANFTPLVEKKFDIEIEHFRQQLENAYKLCKKCEKVLKATIYQKNAWFFGNRLKALRKQGLGIIDLTKSTHGYTKEIKQSFCIRWIKYTLILLAVLINCQILNVKIDYSPESLQNLTPKEFRGYNHILKDALNLFQNKTKNISQELLNLTSYLPQNVLIKTSSTALISFVGCLLQILIVLFERSSKMWKLNELLGWLVLVLTSVVEVDKLYSPFIELFKIFSSLMLLYSYLSGNTSATGRRSFANKKYEFKKLKRTVESEESFDEDEMLEEKLSISGSSAKSKKSFKDFVNKSYRASSPVDTYSMGSNTATLNRSFYTAKSTGAPSVFNRIANNSDNELNRSLEHLNINFVSPSCTSPIYSIKRPVLTPPKLKSVTQNPWTAGGFWKNDISAFPVSTDINSFSRSSSQSSGFVSTNEVVNNHHNSAPVSHDHSFNGDAERLSVLSEPAYHFKPINSEQFKPLFCPQQLYYKADNNTFYPVLTQNNMLYIPSSAPQYQNVTLNVANNSSQNMPETVDTNFIKNDNLSSFGNRSVGSISQYQNFQSNFSNGGLKNNQTNLDTSFDKQSVRSVPSNFGNASLRSFNTTTTRFARPGTLIEKPLSGLFKNLDTIKAHSPLQSPQFRQPQSPL